MVLIDYFSVASVVVTVEEIEAEKIKEEIRIEFYHFTDHMLLQVALS